jgi:hypothetical protein
VPLFATEAGATPLTAASACAAFNAWAYVTAAGGASISTMTVTTSCRLVGRSPCSLGPPAGPDTSVSVALKLRGPACAANGDARAIAAAVTHDDAVKEIRARVCREIGRCLWDDFIGIFSTGSRRHTLTRRKCENFRVVKTRQESFLRLMENIFLGSREAAG